MANGTTNTAQGNGTTASITQGDEFVAATNASSSGVIYTSLTAEIVSPAWSSGFNALDNSAHQAGSGIYRIISTVGTQTSNWTASTTSTWVAAIATFKAENGRMFEVF